MIEVRRVNANTFDCFIGNQWATWIRVRKGRSSLTRIGGIQLPYVIMRGLNELIDVNMPITYCQSQEDTLRYCQAM